MEQATRFVGLDVHKDSITIAWIAKRGRKVHIVGKIPNCWKTLRKALGAIAPARNLKVCYEAGPTGYSLHRRLQRARIQTLVIAPSLIPVRSGDRVKTDRRDAARLAELLRSDLLTPVRVPGPKVEALRDLVRSREDAKRVERAARHRLSKFLLRQERPYPGRTRWTRTHLEWIRKQSFENEAQEIVLREYLHAVEEATETVERLSGHIERLLPESSLGPLVRNLQALRGVRLITAAVLAVEIGDFLRFDSAPKLMAYLGLVPSESSTGSRTHRGGITKAGNSHARRSLVESSWSYRMPAQLSRALALRNEALDPEVRAIAWKAQERLCTRYRRMMASRKNRQQVITAIARELAGFVWAIGQYTQRMAS